MRTSKTKNETHNHTKQLNSKKKFLIHNILTKNYQDSTAQLTLQCAQVEMTKVTLLSGLIEKIDAG